MNPFLIPVPIKAGDKFSAKITGLKRCVCVGMVTQLDDYFTCTICGGVVMCSKCNEALLSADHCQGKCPT